jgi:hypothetical protein
VAAHSEAQSAPFGSHRIVLSVGGIEHTLTGLLAAKFADALRDATDARPELLDPANAKVKEGVEQNLYRTLKGDFSR